MFIRAIATHILAINKMNEQLYKNHCQGKYVFPFLFLVEFPSGKIKKGNRLLSRKYFYFPGFNWGLSFNAYFHMV